MDFIENLKNLFVDEDQKQQGGVLNKPNLFEIMEKYKVEDKMEAEYLSELLQKKQNLEKERERIKQEIKDSITLEERKKIEEEIKKEDPFKISNSKFIDYIKDHHKEFKYTLQNEVKTAFSYKNKGSANQWTNDCNGFVYQFFKECYKEGKTKTTKNEYNDFFNTSSNEEKLGAIGAAGQHHFFKKIAKENGIDSVIGGKNILKALKNGEIQDGTLLSFTTKRGRNIGRYEGIGHVAVAVKDNNGKMYIYEFAGSKAKPNFRITEAERWIKHHYGKENFTATPMFPKAQLEYEKHIENKLVFRMESEIERKADKELITQINDIDKEIAKIQNKEINSEEIYEKINLAKMEQREGLRLDNNLNNDNNEQNMVINTNQQENIVNRSYYNS